MRIATWNVNGLRARLELLLAWLREREPDVVGLQELKLADEQFPHAELEALGYRALVHGQKAWNGVALLARAPLALESPLRGLPGQEGMGSRLVSAEVGGFRVASLYAPNGRSLTDPEFARKLAWFDALADHAVEMRAGGTPLVLMGDLNVCPGPLDTWDEARLSGQIFHSPDERARFRRLLDLGLLDVFREQQPESRAFTWWDYRGGAFHRGQGLRIDFLLADPELGVRVKQVEIDREWRKKRDGLTPSDHVPVWMDLA